MIRDDISMLAGVVATVGSPEFPARFLATLETLCGARLFSAFCFRGADAPRTLFAEGECRGAPDFARTASTAYSRRYWRQDSDVRRAGAGVRVVRTCAGDIADADYRRTCYENGGIGERLSIQAAGRQPLIANGYRAASDGGFRPGDIARLEDFAPLLMAALSRHVELSASRPGDETPAAVRQTLLSADAGLSAREAEVAAGFILGRTQGEIGIETGLTLSSVITYRRRAYCKLGVMDKQELLATYRQLRLSSTMNS